MSDTTITQVIPITNKQIKDMSRQRFGSLVAIGYVGSRPVGKRGCGRAFWLCLCDCGSHVVIDGANLRSSNSKNCGCQKVERLRKLGKANKTHGMKRTPEYRAWNGMKDRCENPNMESYPRYGGRGIKVCEQWKSFERFFADLGLRPSSTHSLDRIDNDGDYCPDNCRWATRIEQGNNRTVNHIVTFKGQNHTVAEWASIKGINYATLWSRLFKQGWSAERAMGENVDTSKWIRLQLSHLAPINKK